MPNNITNYSDTAQKLKFSIKVSLVNVNKLAEQCGFVIIY